MIDVQAKASLPNASAPENLIAPFWDDLHPSGGQYWFYSDGIQCVISFITVGHYGGGGPYTFQVVLDAGGSITYNYTDLGSPFNSATVGIQNSDRTIGLQVAYDQDYLHNLMSVRFTQGWLSVSPTGGLIGPGGQVNTNVIVDTRGLANGTYMGTIAVRGWDQNNELNPITVPVALTVGPPSGQPDIHPSITSITETLPAGSSKADTLLLENAGNANLTYSLADDRAWITLNPESGIVPPTMRDTVVVNISASMLSPGTYLGQITVNSNDPDQPVINIPVHLTVTGGGGACQYTVGDVNGNGSFNGLDVVYSVSYFKGGALPPYSCECTPGNTWFVSGDVNASCNFNGLDVSYMVSFFKGGPLCHPCPDCMPSLDLAPGAGQPAPMILPTPKSKVDMNLGENGN